MICEYSTEYSFQGMSNHKGIPTIGARGIQFRSRIEAQWAYIFETLEWNWDYEPIDLQGYIPDFIIRFDDANEILIEIKGDVNIWKEEVYTPHKDKIIKSGWKGQFGILGGAYKEGSAESWINIGKLFNGGWCQDDLVLRKNNKNNKWSLGGDKESVQETYQYHTIQKEFSKLWVEAKNKVQWKGIQNKERRVQPVIIEYRKEQQPQTIIWREDVVPQQLICKNCNRVYKTKRSLVSHELNCIGIDVLTCPTCMIHFTTRHAKSKHIANNKCKPRSLRTLSIYLIRDYGNERMDYLDYDKMFDIFKSAYNIPTMLTKYIHFYKEFPENNNILNNNDDKNYALVKTGDEYIFKNTNSLVQELVNDKREMMHDFVSKNNDDICESKTNKIDKTNIVDMFQLIRLEETSHYYKKQLANIRDMIKNSNPLQG